MKAAILREFNKPLALERIAIPSIGPNDVLINIKAAGICQSDVHKWHGRESVKMPLIPGHECSGIIAEVGANVTKVKPGDRVLMDYRITCGDCYYCNLGRSNLCDTARDIGDNVNGGYAEYVAVPYRQAFPLPNEIGFDEAAIIGCAVATAYHATKRVAELQPGETVAIIGLGGVGYHILKFARAFGARKIIAVDLDERKLDRAAKLGAETVNPGSDSPDKTILEHTEGHGVNVAFEAVGLPRTVEASIRSVSRAGRAVLVGVCPDKIELSPWNDMMFDQRTQNSSREIQVRPSVDHVRADLTEIIEMVAQNRVQLSDSVTQRITLDEVNRGLEMMDKKIDDPVRIVMHP